MMKKQIQTSSAAELAAAGLTKAVIAIGTFDGLHTGHEKLIAGLLDLASKHQAEPVVMTFFPHPRMILTPDNPPPLLIPPARRLELLYRKGIRAVVTVPFTAEFSKLSPEEFLDRCLWQSGMDIRGICVGTCWRFGAKGAGNTEFLAEQAKLHHCELVPVRELETDGVRVSSTRIRAEIAEGDIRKANLYLGRYYRLFGTVVHGAGLAGTLLHCPTANIEIEYGVLPKAGVYAVFAWTSGKRFRGIANVGTAPTFDGCGRPGVTRIEVHILETAENLYDRKMQLDFVEYLRAERKFDGAESLQEQIQQDIETAEEILKKQEGKH